MNGVLKILITGIIAVLLILTAVVFIAIYIIEMFKFNLMAGISTLLVCIGCVGLGRIIQGLIDDYEKSPQK